MKKRILLLLIVLLFSAGSLAARPILIKLGSAAPDNSIWADSLKKMAAEWNRISDGQIQVKIYFAGFQDEADLIRKMKFNQLQAGILTGVGLQQLYPNVLAFSMPFLIQSDDEFSYVLDEMENTMKEEISKTGFKLLAWAKAGWIYFYTKEPITYPSDLKRMKIASSGTEAQDLMNAMKNIGFHPVSVASGEVLSALTSGMVEAIYSTPLMTGAMQWFGPADNVADMKVAPFLGGILISERVWRQIPDDIKPELLEVTEKIGAELDREIERLEEEATEQMKEYGLKVNPVPEDAREEWEKLFEQGRRQSGRTIYSDEFMERLQSIIDEYRRRNQ
ncbi:MAG: TRAP transporter substrate-binding protein DctP [Sediminispirochaetaceae bacterium]